MYAIRSYYEERRVSRRHPQRVESRARVRPVVVRLRPRVQGIVAGGAEVRHSGQRIMLGVPPRDARVDGPRRRLRVTGSAVGKRQRRAGLVADRAQGRRGQRGTPRHGVTGRAIRREPGGVHRVITSYSIHYTKLYDTFPGLTGATYDSGVQTCALTCHGHLHGGSSWSGAASHAVPYLDTSHTTVNFV